MLSLVSRHVKAGPKRRTANVTKSAHFTDVELNIILSKNQQLFGLDRDWPTSFLWLTILELPESVP